MFAHRESRWWLKPLIHVAVLAAVVWGVRGTILEAIDELRDFRWQLDPWWLLISAALYLLGMLPMGWFWFRALRALGQRPGFVETVRAFYIGHLGKYVPGKAMVVVLRAGLLRGERVNTAVAAASVFLETLTMMAVGAFLAAAALVIAPQSYASNQQHLIPLAIALMLLAGLPTLPPIFRRAARALGIGRSDPEIEAKLLRVNFPLMLSGWIAVSLGWVFLALSLWAVLQAMGIQGLQPLGHLHFYVAAVALAIVAGFLSLIPGGAGVRELILTAILGEVYFSSVLHMPLAHAAALSAAVILRLVWLAAELAAAAVLFFLVRRDEEAAANRNSQQP